MRAVGNTTHTPYIEHCNYRGILNTGAGSADGGHQSRKQSKSDRQIPAARSLRNDNKTPSTSEQRRDRPTCWRWGVGLWLSEKRVEGKAPPQCCKEKKGGKKREEKRKSLQYGLRFPQLNCACSLMVGKIKKKYSMETCSSC